jgi:hypothetical protein
MFSNHRISEILSLLLLKPIHLQSYGFFPQFSTNPTDFNLLFADSDSHYQGNGQCIWWHEEPLDLQSFDDIIWNLDATPNFSKFPCLATVPAMCDWYQDVNFHLLANSEKGIYKKELLAKYKFYDWYFFYHGFAALDWFRDYQYLQFPETNITKIFMSLNHLLLKKRSYRLTLLSHFKEQGLDQHGHISSPILNKNLVKQELFNKHSLLSVSNKKHIFKNLLPTATSMTLDDQTDYKSASANIIDLKFALGALWHVVSETVYYEDRLHLTEKIFKPIVTKRPFILVGAVGNLEYLRSYGFQTFGRWINESYDNEPDPDIRMCMIINEIKKLCKLPKYKLLEMFNEMQPILEFNQNYFYNNFKVIITNELIDNFQKAVMLYNKDLSERFRIPDQQLDFNKIRKILIN